MITSITTQMRTRKNPENDSFLRFFKSDLGSARTLTSCGIAKASRGRRIGGVGLCEQDEQDNPKTRLVRAFKTAGGMGASRTREIARKIPNFSASSISISNNHKSFGQNNSSTSFPNRPLIQLNSDIFILTPKNSIPWIKDANILTAINKLNYLEFDKSDIETVEKVGAVIPFACGREAVDFIKKANIRIKFDTLPSVGTHAQYDFDENCIMINEIYKSTKNEAEILAIAEAILHETGHAKDNDGDSSIQEEIDCLALNAISHRALKRKFPNISFEQDSLIIKEGVCVYAGLFFDEDQTKVALIKRIKQKYENLPAGDFKHPPSDLAFRIKTA